MFLHEDQGAFIQTMKMISTQTGIAVPVLEKDYWVFMLLKLIRINNPDVMFKGGTSLSKAYGVINRFSEDIDLNAIPSNPLTEGKRRDFNVGVKAAFETLGLKLRNELIRTRSDFVCFIADYPQLGGSVSYLTDVLKVESVLRRKGRVPTCKYVVKTVSNYIYDSLSKDMGNLVRLRMYGLDPFDIYVQDIRYTLCEKLISIGNNYLRGKSDRLSRHLYDVKKIMDLRLDMYDLRRVFLEVVPYIQERGFDDAILGNTNLEDVVYKAMSTDFYKEDFAQVSSKFIWEPTSYDVCKQAVLHLVSVGVMNMCSNTPDLRDLHVQQVGDKWGVCHVDSMGVEEVSIDYLYKNRDRLRNKKFTSDGKIIDRFR